MRLVQWSRAALDDLKKQATHIATENPAAAKRIAQKIRETGAALGAMPIGRAGRVLGSYEKLVTSIPFIIAYELTDTTVIILRVIHTSRDWPSDSWPQ